MRRYDPDDDSLLEEITTAREAEHLERALAAADKTTWHYPPDTGGEDGWEL